MFDPVVCPPSEPDLFLHLTGAAWTAIGSIVSTASVIALVVYNWEYLRIARAQTAAAIEQARVAQETLDGLRAQLANQEEVEGHSVLIIIQHAYANLGLWRENLIISTVPEQNLIQLLPDTWNLVLIYISRHHYSLTERLAQLTHQIRKTQLFVSEVIQTDHRHRSSNSSLKARIDQLITYIDQSRADLREIEHLISSSIIHS